MRYCSLLRHHTFEGEKEIGPAVRISLMPTRAVARDFVTKLPSLKNGS
jgi:hypothetical protein